MILSKILIRILFSIVIILALTLSSILATTPAVDGKASKVKVEGPLYTAYNIWYEVGKENALWCINYKKGEMIPAGTEIEDVRLVKAEYGKIIGGGQRAIAFTTVDDGQEYLVNFNQKFHPEQDIEDYMDLMFTEKDYEQLTEGMNEKEIAGIKKGVIKIGMSKEAVLVSYGYPPEHKTTNLNKDVWFYWTSRLVSKAIHFDENDLAYRPVIESDEL